MFVKSEKSRKVVDEKIIKDDVLLPSLIDERVLVYGVNYFYTGILVAIDDFNIELEDVSIVYDTGDHDADNFADSQKLKGNRIINRNAYESIERLDITL